MVCERKKPSTSEQGKSGHTNISKAFTPEWAKLLLASSPFKKADIYSSKLGYSASRSDNQLVEVIQKALVSLSNGSLFRIQELQGMGHLQRPIPQEPQEAFSSLMFRQPDKIAPFDRLVKRLSQGSEKAKEHAKELRTFKSLALQRYTGPSNHFADTLEEQSLTLRRLAQELETITLQNNKSILIIFDLDKTIIPFDSFAANRLKARRRNLKPGIGDLFKTLKGTSIDIAFASHNSAPNLVLDYKNILLGTNFRAPVVAHYGRSKIDHLTKVATAHGKDYNLVVFVDDRPPYLQEFLALPESRWRKRLAIQAHEGKDNLAKLLEGLLRILSVGTP